MEFGFETRYDKEALMALSLAMRKTVGKKRRRNQCILGGIVMLAGLVRIVLAFWKGNWDGTVLVSVAAIALVLYTILCEDRISANNRSRAASAEQPHIFATFLDEDYCTVMDGSEMRREYEEVKYLAETERYFALILGPRHAQLYDKRSITGGTEEEFRAFIEEKTGRTMEKCLQK